MLLHPPRTIDHQVPDDAHRNQRCDAEEDRDCEHRREAGSLAVQHALELSVAGFFRKPFDLGEMLERIEQLAGREDARAASPGGRTV